MLWICNKCTTRYAPAPQCPNCGTKAHTVQGEK